MSTSLIRAGAVQALLKVSTGNASTDETMTPVATSFSGLSSSPPVRHGFTIQSSPTRTSHAGIGISIGTDNSKNVSMGMGISTKLPTTCTAAMATGSISTSTNSSRKNSTVKVQGSSALDALATLASSAHEQDGVMTSSSDSDRMPPPPPRRKFLVRKRSASNPEGMEKWDSYRADPNNRMHFVLPSTILEEELESAHYACEEHEKKVQLGQENTHHYGNGDMHLNFHHKNMSRPILRTAMTDFSIIAQPDVDKTNELYGTSPTTIIMSMPIKSNGKGKPQSSSSSSKRGPKKNKLQHMEQQTAKIEIDLEEEEEEIIDESKLEPEELLRRARSKLFEDLSAENGGPEKGVMAFPHSLEKYKEIYNKNGRIGIYTPAERAAIIAKFNSKRTRRTWKKKIRYNCRKNLADRRMRVKGRFVKRAVEQTQNQKTTTTTTVPIAIPEEPVPVANISTTSTVNVQMNERTRTRSDSIPHCGTSPMHVDSAGLLVTPNESSSDSADSSRTPSPVHVHPTILAPVRENLDTCVSVDTDMDMPDVEDPDAGFKPTASQPFRRTRRHTIT